MLGHTSFTSAALSLLIACGTATRTGPIASPDKSPAGERSIPAYPLRLDPLPPRARELVAQRFVEQSGITWDVVSVNVFGQVTALIRGDDLLPVEATFAGRRAFWAEVLGRMTPKEIECADLGCEHQSVNSATLRAGAASLFWQLNHATKATLILSRPSIVPSASSMSDERLTQASRFELPATIRAPHATRRCPTCNEETVIVATKVTGLRWHQGQMIVMAADGAISARKFAWPTITMVAVPEPDGSSRPWSAAQFQDTRLSNRKIDAVSGEDLSTLVCRANSGHPALACGEDEELLERLSTLLGEHTTSSGGR